MFWCHVQNWLHRVHAVQPTEISGATYVQYFIYNYANNIEIYLDIIIQMQIYYKDLYMNFETMQQCS